MSETNKEKKKSVFIGVPAPDYINKQFTFNLPVLIAHTIQHFGKDEVQLAISAESGVRTDRNRNIILQNFFKSGFDYILWLDCDQMYPKDMIVKYLNHGKKVTGCLYFKRSHPHWPVVYKWAEENNPNKPYCPVDISKTPRKLVEVDGVGFGGMMVHRSVYEALDEPWMKYGPNYHLPPELINEVGGGTSHDLEFCRRVRSKGIKIHADLSVQAGHIQSMIIDEKDFVEAMPELNKGEDYPIQALKQAKIAVFIPTLDEDKGVKTGKMVFKRSGLDDNLDVYVEVDKKKIGWPSMINKMYQENNDYDYFVYLTDDVYPSKGWLKTGLKAMKKRDAGLLALNGGKWKGLLAPYGIVDKKWIQKLGGDYENKILCDEYEHYYSDSELSLIAKENQKFSYEPDAVMMEVDYRLDRDDKVPHLDIFKRDRELFHKRKEDGFNGKVKTKALLNSIN